MPFRTLPEPPRGGHNLVVNPVGRPDLFYQEVADGGVLFDADGARVYVLNVSAAYVWNCCDGDHSVDQIADELAAALGTQAPERGALVADVEKSLDEFRRAGLLAS